MERVGRMSLTKEDVMSVKGRGFLRNRGTDCFSGRVVSIGGVFGAEQLRALAVGRLNGEGEALWEKIRLLRRRR